MCAVQKSDATFGRDSCKVTHHLSLNNK